jgi:hypothetical protein
VGEYFGPDSMTDIAAERVHERYAGDALVHVRVHDFEP